MPTAFTPNGDGLNDLLIPYLVGTKSLNRFTIYNRWGNPLFTTSATGKEWDGKYKGADQPVGVYVWMIEYTTYDNITAVEKGIVAPEQIQNVFTVDDIILVFIQQLQQLRFPERKFSFFITIIQRLPVDMEKEFTDRHHIAERFCFRLVAQHIINTGNQLFHTKRLADIVIAADRKTFYYIFRLRFRS